MSAKKPPFEHSLARLEEIVEALQSEDLELDRALRLFEEGVEQLRLAAHELARADAQLKVLTEKASGALELSDFRD